MTILSYHITLDSDGLEAISAAVLVCVNQQYVYICADNWDNREADVACRSYYSYNQLPFYGITLKYPF